jgi:hypothetical protein
MSCCGKKRKEWLSQQAAPATSERSRRTMQEPAREFEYTGPNAFSVRGAYTGNSYSFRYPGERVMVDYQDSFALMAEGELRVVARAGR